MYSFMVRIFYSFLSAGKHRQTSPRNKWAWKAAGKTLHKSVVKYGDALQF
jgi:hypothetical protein